MTRQRQPSNRAAHSPTVVEECRREALQLLHRNLTPQGILAATRSPKAESRHYDCIFGRDAAICALAMTLSGDARLVPARGMA